MTKNRRHVFNAFLVRGHKPVTYGKKWNIHVIQCHRPVTVGIMIIYVTVLFTHDSPKCEFRLITD